MSQANPLWGAPRIHGELLKLGINLSQTTVAKYMIRHPRRPSPSWRAFLIDFFTVPTITFHILFVFLVLSHDRRRILHSSVTEHPTAAWTRQQLIEAFPWDGAPRYLIRDRDGIYGHDFTRRVRRGRIRMSSASSDPFGANASTTWWSSTRTICEEYCEATFATTMRRARTFRSARMPPSRGKSNLRNSVRSSSSPRLAGSTTDTPDGRPDNSRDLTLSWRWRSAPKNRRDCLSGQQRHPSCRSPVAISGRSIAALPTGSGKGAWTRFLVGTPPRSYHIRLRMLPSCEVGSPSSHQGSLAML